MILMLGDDPEDYMARSGVKWLHGLGVNVMSMSLGKKDGCREWPIEGESLFSYKGKPLPFMPSAYQHPDYWRVIATESKRTGNMINSWKLFYDSEKAHLHRPEEMIQVENIKGKLLLIGASGDCLWIR